MVRNDVHRGVAAVSSSSVPMVYGVVRRRTGSGGGGSGAPRAGDGAATLVPPYTPRVLPGRCSVLLFMGWLGGGGVWWWPPRTPSSQRGGLSATMAMRVLVFLGRLSHPLCLSNGFTGQSSGDLHKCVPLPSIPCSAALLPSTQHEKDFVLYPAQCSNPLPGMNLVSSRSRQTRCILQPPLIQATPSPAERSRLGPTIG